MPVHDSPMPDHWFLLAGWDDEPMPVPTFSAWTVPGHEETRDEWMLACIFAGAR